MRPIDISFTCLQGEDLAHLARSRLVNSRACRHGSNLRVFLAKKHGNEWKMMISVLCMLVLGDSIVNGCPCPVRSSAGTHFLQSYETVLYQALSFTKYDCMLKSREQSPYLPWDWSVIFKACSLHCCSMNAHVTYAYSSICAQHLEKYSNISR